MVTYILLKARTLRHVSKFSVRFLMRIYTAVAISTLLAFIFYITFQSPIYITDMQIQTETTDDNTYGDIPEKTLSKLFQISSASDRVSEQMLYTEQWLKHIADDDEEYPQPKVIYNKGITREMGESYFRKEGCPIDLCLFTEEMSSDVDAVMFEDDIDEDIEMNRTDNQVWIYTSMRVPDTYPVHPTSNLHVNWTATYRKDSTLVRPFRQWKPYMKGMGHVPQHTSFAEGKNKLVAWISLSPGDNDSRRDYITELNKHIPVHIYGETVSCISNDHNECMAEIAKHYKFYLAFEEVQCPDYITDVYFLDGLSHNILPIVMGGHPSDYERVSPPDSFIHVDDFASSQQLAQYLNFLDNNDDLYNEYFKWKDAGYYADSRFYCRLCSMLHVSHPAAMTSSMTSSIDISKWWLENSACK